MLDASAATVGDRPGSTPVKLLIGAGDEGEISVYGVPDLNTKFRVSSDGFITFPLLGEVKLAGMSADEAQAMLEKQLVDHGLLVNPHVTVFVKEYRSQAVSVMGEVMKPGFYPVSSSHRLYDIFLMAGGLTPRAGSVVTITHASQQSEPVTVKISSDPNKMGASNVDVLPGDTIVVSKAGMVYVLGEVNRPGAFVVENNQTVTLLQALSLALGPTRMASLSHARIIRRKPNGLENVDVDLKNLLQAKSSDVDLKPEDIVFVPSSRGKMAADRGSSSILSLLTGLALYRF